MSKISTNNTTISCSQGLTCNTYSGGLSTLTINSSYGTSMSDIYEPNRDIVEFLDFVMKILGVEITYYEFNKMSSYERKSLLRDIKLNSILK